MLVFCLCLSPANAFAQDSLRSRITPNAVPDSVWSVGTVAVVGNSHTKDFVILREMTLKPGVPITRALMEYDQSRIYSLRLFNQVQLRIIPTSSPGTANLIVEVSERWYIFPFPIFGIRDRDWSKVYYGLGLLHANFRGRNEKLFASLIAGYDPSFMLSYTNPFISEDGTDFLGARIAYSKVRNKSLLAEAGTDNFDERHFSTSVTYGKRFGIEHTAWLNAGYELVDVDNQLPGRAISPDGKDRYPVLSIGYSYDTRDLSEYPDDGTLARASITKYGVSTATVNIVRYDADVRKYVPLLPRVTLAGRVFGNLAAAGPTPSYNRVFFGYGERIRGHFKDVFEGEDIFGTSFELHYTLLSPKYFSVGILPAEFGLWRFGVVAAAFADAGSVWFRGEPLAIDRFLRGYGIGLHFLLPYSFVLRTEYAWNELRHAEFILDVGAAL
jgi:outer membrane protein assembly factor BamA